MMLSLLRDFFHFYTSKKSVDYKNINSAVWLISGLILLFSFKTVFGLLRFILIKNNLMTSTTGAGSPEEWIKQTSLNIFVFQVLLLAPIIEEFSFRGVLQSNKILFNFSFVVFIFLVVCKIANLPIYTPSIASIIVFFSILLVVIFLRNNVMIVLNEIVIENTKIFVFITSILFALWHYGNFDFSNASLFTIFFTFLPYFVSGLIFAWISIKKGFQFGLLLHIVSNSLPVMITYFNQK